jgi:hypothetical protein
LGESWPEHLGNPIGIILASMKAVFDDKGCRRTVNVVKNARETRPIRIKEMVVQAGARDGSTEERANAFEKNMISLIESARRDFGNPCLPLVINLAIDKPGKWPFVMHIWKG